MFEEFRSYIKAHELLRSDDRVLLAVSGGIDSMVMAHLFLNLGTVTGIAHCNFCLRGDESDKDEELVRNFSVKNRIPFYSTRFKTKEYARNKRISVQMAARELRYEWFETIREENNFDLIAVAHNMNDNIETVLINLIRGTGITGLSGMRPSGNNIIRPLLFASREKITSYCNDNKIPFREDKSNAETRYTRNKIRHLLIPLLKEINPSVEETLTETAEKMAGVDEILSGYINELRSQLSASNGKTTVFNIDKLQGLGAGKALIYEIFSPFGITGATTGDLIKIIKGVTGKQIFTKTHRIVRNRNELIVNPLEPAHHEYHIINTTEDLFIVPQIVSAKIMDIKSGFKIPDKQSIACIDLEKIKFPLLIRTWKKGDYFFPLGMKEKKKLSDYFIDRKFSLVKKEKALILESDGNIVWIIGERIDDRYRITPTTSKVLMIEAAIL